jgi:LacI family transcriptional regulator, galactose operon repressor
MRPRVALLIESSRGYGRGLLQGIADYVRVHGHWSVYLERHHLYDVPPAWLKKWRGDGIIARVENPRLVDAIRAQQVPVVDLRGLGFQLQMPAILTDDEAGALMAAEHFLEKGFRNFAYCGYAGMRYSDVRSQVFHKTVSRAGFHCTIYHPTTHPRREDIVKQEQHGFVGEGKLAAWLRELPKPVGLMACNDARGQQVLNACRDVGISIPDEVAVVGVDNDELVCDLCDPPLSSLVPNTRKIGYEGASLLESMMAGAPSPAEPIYVRPVGIVARRSSDVLAMDDPDVAAAVRFIRDHACNGISVEDVLQRVPMSWSSLERQFHKMLGRGPKAEITRVQVERVKQLLSGTDLPLKDIAARSGFTHTEYLSVVFKKKTGFTPGQYRSQMQQTKNGEGTADGTQRSEAKLGPWSKTGSL